MTKLNFMARLALLSGMTVLLVSGCARGKAPSSSQQSSAGSSAAWVSPDSAAASHSSPAASAKSSAGVSSVTVAGAHIDIAPPSITMLVNKNHLVSASYGDGALDKLDSSYYINKDKDNRFDKRALPYLKQMLDDAKAAGYNLKIVSGYRTYAYQKANFQRKVTYFISQGQKTPQATSNAAALVNPPGTSEHETGLAADIVTADWYNTNKDLTEAFDQTPAFAWLSSQCTDYGFILRYPKGKQASTSISYEPWHYRYVGKDLAVKIKASGKSFEEYLGVS